MEKIEIFYKKINQLRADSAVYYKFKRESVMDSDSRQWVGNFDSFFESLEKTLSEISKFYELPKKNYKPSRPFSELLNGWEDVDNRRRLLFRAGGRFNEEVEELENYLFLFDGWDSLPARAFSEKIKSSRVGLYMWQ